MQNLDKLLEAICNDYAKLDPKGESSYTQGELEKMKKGITLKVEEGKKYIKIIHGNSVWGFVVNVHDDKQFRFGDLLKAAGWKTPARNKPRGNVVDGDFSWVRWTGPDYLFNR